MQRAENKIYKQFIMVGQGQQKNIPNREEEIFEEVFKANFRNLYVHAFSIVKNESAAKEIVQQIFFKLWKKKEILGQQPSLTAYLYKAVANESLNHLKHIKIRTAYRESSQHLHPGITPQNEQTGLKDLERKIALTLEKLPEKCRLVFQLSRYEELKYGEIADKLGISVKAVEKHITKALKVFRTQLKDYMLLLFIICLTR